VWKRCRLAVVGEDLVELIEEVHAEDLLVQYDVLPEESADAETAGPPSSPPLDDLVDESSAAPETAHADLFGAGETTADTAAGKGETADSTPEAAVADDTAADDDPFEQQSFGDLNHSTTDDGRGHPSTDTTRWTESTSDTTPPSPDHNTESPRASADRSWLSWLKRLVTNTRPSGPRMPSGRIDRYALKRPWGSLLVRVGVGGLLCAFVAGATAGTVLDIVATLAALVWLVAIVAFIPMLYLDMRRVRLLTEWNPSPPLYALGSLCMLYPFLLVFYAYKRRTTPQEPPGTTPAEVKAYLSRAD
jgi:hypothetical protein